MPVQALRLILSCLSIFLPWSIRRRFLKIAFNYDLHPKAFIGASIVLSRGLCLGEGSRIGHFNLIRSLDQVELRAYARIGHFNWIGGTPTGNAFFAGEPDRVSALIMDKHSAITSSHRLDCTNKIEIGAFSTLGGHRSQIVTHGINIYENKQVSSAIKIGSHCYVGTGVILLKGAVLPDYCLLAAGSVLSKAYEEPYMLYSGNPAQPVRELPRDAKYFSREIGFVF